MADLLKADEAKARLKKIPEWELEKKHIERTFEFDDFSESIDFVPAFIRIDELKHRFDLGPFLHSGFAFPTFQNFGSVVAPAELAHELVPHRDLFFARPPALRECPLEHLIVRRARVYAFHNFVVIEVEKRAAFCVESF